MLDFSQPRS